MDKYNEFLNNAIEIVKFSTLSEEEKIAFIDFISKFNFDQIVNFLQIVSEKPEFIEMLNDNLKRKKSIPLNDVAAWDKIVEEEEKYLSSIGK